MKSLRLWVLLMAMVTALVFLVLSSSITGNLVSFSDTVFPGHGETVRVMTTNRKLKEKSFAFSPTIYRRDLTTIFTEDYPSYDPAPSSKAAVRPKPIEHDTPLMPYVPGPIRAPPGPAKPGRPGNP